LVGVEGLVGKVLFPVRDRVDIEDVLQDAAIAILKSYKDAPRTKAIWTAKNAVRTAMRAKIHDHKFFENSSRGVVDSDPLAALLKCEQVEFLHAAMKQLVEQDREAIRLRFFEEMTLEQVGEAMGFQKRHAAHVVKRALERLRELMQD
jgi:RNA polymerase sigma factor (sigma-70 family)